MKRSLTVGMIAVLWEVSAHAQGFLQEEAKTKSEEEELARPFTNDCNFENRRLSDLCGHVWRDPNGRITECSYPSERTAAWQKKVEACEAARVTREKERSRNLDPKLTRPVLSALLCIQERERKAMVAEQRQAAKLIKSGAVDESDVPITDTGDIDKTIAATRAELRSRSLKPIPCTQSTVAVRICGGQITVDAAGHLTACQRGRMYRADTLVDLLVYCLDDQAPGLDRCQRPEIQKYVDAASVLRAAMDSQAGDAP